MSDSFRTDMVLPPEPGRYCITVDGVMTFIAIYGDFDGETWKFCGIVNGMSNPVIRWYPNE
jgi:hypothetical protein